MMMSKLANIMAYFCQNFPSNKKLSNARLTKMIYLADVISVKKNNQQLTDINWYFDHYGPFVYDVENEARANPSFKIEHGQTIYGTPKKEVSLVNSNMNIDIDLNTRNILNQVISDTQNLNWNDFIRYIYNTEPIKNSHKYSYLDLNVKR